MCLGRVDAPLDVERAVAERALCLAPGCAKRLVEVLDSFDDPHALAAAARGRLDEQGHAHLRGGRTERLDRLVVRAGARHARHAGLFHQAPGLELGAHARNHVGGRADEGQARIDASGGKCRPFAQEAVARVHGVGAAASRGIDHPRHRQVGGDRTCIGARVRLAPHRDRDTPPHRPPARACVRHRGRRTRPPRPGRVPGTPGRCGPQSRRDWQ